MIAIEFFCTVCNIDYKTRKGLNQHKSTAWHKRKVNPEFAAAEEAEKAANKTVNASSGGDDNAFEMVDAYAQVR